MSNPLENVEHLLEKPISSEKIYSGKIVNLRRDKTQMPGGKVVSREVIEHAPAAVILPWQPPDKLYLVRQYRRPLDRVLLEAPAGIIDLAEDPLVAAKRELQEETGFSAKHWFSLGSAYMTPGFCDELMHFYLASHLTKGDTDFDPDENIDLISTSVSELGRWIDAGEIIDGKTIAVFALAQKFF